MLICSQMHSVRLLRLMSFMAEQSRAPHHLKLPQGLCNRHTLAWFPYQSGSWTLTNTLSKVYGGFVAHWGSKHRTWHCHPWVEQRETQLIVVASRLCWLQSSLSSFFIFFIYFCIQQHHHWHAAVHSVVDRLSQLSIVNLTLGPLPSILSSFLTLKKYTSVFFRGCLQCHRQCVFSWRAEINPNISRRLLICFYHYPSHWC